VPAPRSSPSSSRSGTISTDAVFGKQKVETFGAEGDTFDPALHEAVQDTSTGDEKVLGTVLRKGYRLGERTLRTAMVVIADPQ
jgi:molecular chaperone GrpE